MIDYGLLVSIAAAFLVPSLVAKWWPLRTVEPGVTFIDLAFGPAVTGLVVGRLFTVALDDPGSLGRLPDMLVIRSGVEFWPAVAAAAAVATWSAHRAGTGIADRLADLAPLAMVGYGAYEASCLFRDGCFGPASPLGLRPDGFSTRMVPVGVLMAVAVGAGAWAARRLGDRPDRHLMTVGASVAIVALVRAIASIWLPRVGEAMSRQQLTSVVVAATAGLGCLALGLAHGRRRVSTA
jgi:hypothetical protein